MKSYGLAKRKTSIARVYLRDGKGNIFINKKPIENYFPSIYFPKETISLPLVLINKLNDLDVFVNVRGGGVSSQISASLLGLVRSIISFDSSYKDIINHLNVNDTRVVARKVHGRLKARKKGQYSKR
jgi:small subunit ribosomal protein S9